jgi:two-component system chemotaxis sensor kinase CheA
VTGSSEFLSEAQDIVESFSRQLLEIEQQLKDGDEYDPDLLNGAFRSVHTLKGLSALSGVIEIGELSHELENTLDALRLGKLKVGQSALDLLFEAVDLFSELLASSEGDEATKEIDVTGFLARLDGLRDPKSGAEEANPLAWLDDSILGVLTEYEEHRLRENIRLGRRVYRVHASFDLLAIDVGIEALKQKMKAYGEVITYLPSADSSSDDRIEMDILLGSKAELSEIAAGVGDKGVTVEQLGGTGEEALAKTPSTARPVDEAAPSAAPEFPTPASTQPVQDVGAPAVSAPTTPREPSIEDDIAGAREDAFVDDAVTDVSLRSLSQTVRVDLARLDMLMNLVGELSLVQANLGGLVAGIDLAATGEENRTQLRRGLHDQLRIMSRRLGLLQQGILEVRMVPLGQVFDKLARVVRKVGRESGKDVRLDVSGADTELDKLIVEELSDPLMHMIRNGIDHGIESAAERLSEGKQSTGRIELRAYQKGNRVVIEVEDDGRGINWKKVRDVGVSRGFVTEEEGADMLPSEAISLIFEPGFSTRARATALSGRGVGMDVVKTNIARLSGMIEVDSEPSKGTRFTITLPVTLAIIQALVIESGGETFCISLNSVLESIMVQPDEILTIEGHEVVSLRGRTLPLIHLSKVFELGTRRQLSKHDRLYVVVVGLAQHRVGLVVDELIGQQDVVIKPIGKALRQVPGIAGATELGANRTVLLLDVATLVSEAVRGAAQEGGPLLEDDEGWSHRTTATITGHPAGGR